MAAYLGGKWLMAPSQSPPPFFCSQALNNGPIARASTLATQIWLLVMHRKSLVSLHGRGIVCWLTMQRAVVIAAKLEFLKVPISGD
jgi:hypothetical protein